MKSYKAVFGLMGALCLLTVAVPSVHSQEKSAMAAVQVHLVITNEAIRGDGEVPSLQSGDVKVKQGKTFLKVNQLIRAQGDNAALQLFVLVDDTLGSGIGNNLNDIRDFITAQPASTVVAVGYMSNATVNIVQNFTSDHDLAVKALRLPRGTLSTMDSPYLSLVSQVKGWLQQNVRAVLRSFSGHPEEQGGAPASKCNN